MQNDGGSQKGMYYVWKTQRFGEMGANFLVPIRGRIAFRQGTDMNKHQAASARDIIRNSNCNFGEKVMFIIDDDETILDVICSHLEVCGFQSENLHKFSSAAEALEIIRFVRPNLIISDIHMPGISGDALAKLIQWPVFKNSPVIAITGDSDFRLDGNNGSFLDDVVYKPIDGVDLINKIVATLNRSEQQEQTAENDRRERSQQQNRSIQNKENDLREAFGKA